MEQNKKIKVAEALFDTIKATSDEHGIPFFVVFGSSYMVDGDWRPGMIGAMNDRSSYVKVAVMDCLTAIEKQLQVAHGQPSPPETE